MRLCRFPYHRSADSVQGKVHFLQTARKNRLEEKKQDLQWVQRVVRWQGWQALSITDYWLSSKRYRHSWCRLDHPVWSSSGQWLVCASYWQNGTCRPKWKITHLLNEEWRVLCWLPFQAPSQNRAHWEYIKIIRIRGNKRCCSSRNVAGPGYHW